MHGAVEKILLFLEKFAVGVIIGGAFGKIVSSIVADVIMPPIGLLVGGINCDRMC